MSNVPESEIGPEDQNTNGVTETTQNGNSDLLLATESGQISPELLQMGEELATEVDKQIHNSSARFHEIGIDLDQNLTRRSEIIPITMADLLWAKVVHESQHRIAERRGVNIHEETLVRCYHEMVKELAAIKFAVNVCLGRIQTKGPKTLISTGVKQAERDLPENINPNKALSLSPGNEKAVNMRDIVIGILIKQNLEDGVLDTSASKVIQVYDQVVAHLEQALLARAHAKIRVTSDDAY